MDSSKQDLATSRPQVNSLIYALPLRRLKELLKQIYPDLALELAEDLPSTQLARLYTLNMSEGKKLLLSYAPSLAVRLLRHETTMISSEASLIEFITSTPPSAKTSSTTSSSLKDTPRPRNLSETKSRRSTLEMNTILRLVPKVVKHSSNTRELAHPYSIFEAPDGVLLSTLSIHLSGSEREVIDRDVGLLARALASSTSPNGNFGPSIRVLPGDGVPRAEKELKTWSEGFNILLEGILRDGEDMSVLIPYETIRAHFRRISSRLDAILTPRLLLLNIGSETNLMIERRAGAQTSTDSRKETKLTGLRSWSQGVFGDPLLSDCFEDPSEVFMSGWEEGEIDILEDRENSNARKLIYRCFGAVVAIVTEYYRPQPDSSRRELEGRRKLTSVLAELEKIDIIPPDELELKRMRSV